MHRIGEKKPWCCIDRYNGHWSHVWDWWEETMVLDRQIEWSLVSCMEWDWREEIMMLHGTWEQGPLYLSIQHHGLFSPILYMRPGTTLSVYTKSSSLLTNPIHENRDHSICLYNIMVSSHQSHTWEQGPLYLSIQHHGLFSPTLFMRPWTTLSVYATSWSLLTNSIPYMRPGTTLSVYATPWSLLTNPIHERPLTILFVYTTSWSLHGVGYTDRVVPALMYGMGLVRRDHDVA
jgi:hypothetical protein